MSKPGKWLIALACLTIGCSVIWHFLHAAKTATPPPAPVVASSNAPVPAMIAVHASKPATMPPPSDDDAVEMVPLPEVDPARIADCLSHEPRDAAHLLAAFRLTKDTNYLNEAATTFPDNPAVQFTVLARKAFPDDRRKWLDRFEASSPNNSLANYLSAQDYFEQGNTNAAVRELLAVDGKQSFQNFGVESQLDQEALAACSGKSPADAGRIALVRFSEENLPIAATLKRLVLHMADLQKQYAAAGDHDSSENMAVAELDLADQVNRGDSGKYMINQLVAMAMQAIALNGLDQNTPCDFLDGETPAQASQDIKAQKLQLVQINRQFNALYSQFTQDELANYQERVKIYGEINAMRWLVAQHPQAQQP